MARYTRSDLINIVRNDEHVKFLTEGNEEKITQGVETLCSHFVNHCRLEYVDDTWSISEHTQGRPRQAYDGYQFYHKLTDYLKSVSNRKINTRKAIALALKAHFELMDYASSPEGLTREEAFWKDVQRQKQLKKEAEDVK